MKICGIFFLLMVSVFSSAQLPFYYKIKNVNGSIYTRQSSPIHVEFKSRRELKITNCADPDIIQFLNTLTYTRLSRKYLEHLITTSSKITLSISDKVGILYKDGKYRLIAGLTGPEEFQSAIEIIECTSNIKGKKKIDTNKVYAENSIEIFKGSIAYAHQHYTLDTSNTQIFDAKMNKRVPDFKMDTIKIEPILNPDYLYRNITELYYFSGIHELFHTTCFNIMKQRTNSPDIEKDAFDLELKAFRKRSKINKRAIGNH